MENGKESPELQKEKEKAPTESGAFKLGMKGLARRWY
jgi:hypothetical protein